MLDLVFPKGSSNGNTLALSKLKFAFLQKVARDFFNAKENFSECGGEGVCDYIKTQFDQNPALCHSFYNTAVMPLALGFLYQGQYLQERQQLQKNAVPLLANLCIEWQRRLQHLPNFSLEYFGREYRGTEHQGGFDLYLPQKNVFLKKIVALSCEDNIFYIRRGQEENFIALDDCVSGTRTYRHFSGFESQKNARFVGLGPQTDIEKPHGRGFSTNKGELPTALRNILSSCLTLRLFDTNPLQGLEYHPEKKGSALSLGDKPVEQWVGAYQNAAGYLQQYAVGFLDEFAVLTPSIVPVGYDPERHFSASYREAVGSLYMSLHDDEMVLLGALIHEFQHNKIYLMSYFDEILFNAFDGLYDSPVRPDPRPLWGLLLGAHAFVPVAMVYQRILAGADVSYDKKKLKKELDKICEKNQDGLTTLGRHGKFTPYGKKLFALLQHYHQEVSCPS